jgi:hypothetical protein
VLPEAVDDGLLTAAEAATLDLAGTELVVLSACETGLGEARTGEGVLGLQRGFLVAGARAVVMALWRVPDLATRELMEAFYTALMAGQSHRAALTAARAAVRAKYAHPAFWGGFVLVGHPGPPTAIDAMASAEAGTGPPPTPPGRGRGRLGQRVDAILASMRNLWAGGRGNRRQQDAAGR